MAHNEAGRRLGAALILGNLAVDLPADCAGAYLAPPPSRLRAALRDEGLRGEMSSFLKRLCLGTVAAWLLAAPGAHAFTVENREAGDGTGSGFSGNPYAPPTFDLEEQAKNFRSGGTSITSPGPKTDFSTPYGSGSVTFGVQQGSAFGGSGFGPGGTSSFTGSRANRADFERMVTTEGMR